MARTIDTVRFATCLAILWALPAHAQMPPAPRDPGVTRNETRPPDPAASTLQPPASPAPVPTAYAAPAPPQAMVIIDPATGRPMMQNGPMPRLQQRPATLPYVEGAPIPQGYTLQESNLPGLVIGGVIPLGILYLISFSVASTNDFKGPAGWLAVPVVGPFGWLAASHKSASSCYGCDEAVDAFERTLVTLDGIFQVTSAAMFVAGLAITRKRLVLTDPQVYVVPYTSSNAHGLSLIGQF